MSALRRRRGRKDLRLDERRLARLRPSGDRLERIEFAGGDIVTLAQGAVLAAASGTQAAAALNHDLTAELATSGALP